jgi:hypothetical protein
MADLSVAGYHTTEARNFYGARRAMRDNVELRGAAGLAPRLSIVCHQKSSTRSRSSALRQLSAQLITASARRRSSAGQLTLDRSDDIL